MFSFNKKLFLLLFLICVLACSPGGIQKDNRFDETSISLIVPEEERSINNCISPPKTFAYSLSPLEDPVIVQTTLPLEPWELVTIVESDFSFVEISGVRIQDEHQEIWLVSGGEQKFYIYDPVLDDWDEVSFGLGELIQIEKLFFLPDETVFGVPDLSKYNERSEISVLSKYNEETKSFEFVQSLQEIPISAKGNPDTTTQVIFDIKRELFWFLVPDDAIYSFDPETQDVVQYLDIPQEENLDVKIANMSNSGEIYMLSLKGFSYTNEGNLFMKFNPDTNSISQFYMPLAPWPLALDFFVDQSDRVWFGTVGWLEPDGRWYQMVPSPIFITNPIFSPEHRWKSPSIELESKDGRLWMRFELGMVWLDPDKEEWCWFTTKESNIFEDADGNLWMVVDNSLYKLSIND